MIKIIFGAILGRFVLFTIYRFTYSHFEETGRHQFEDGEYCESFENTKRAMYLNSEPSSLFASFYARGLCVSQDLEKAKEIYQSKPQKDLPAMPVWLFYEGIEIARADQRNNQPSQLDKIRPLFLEAKNFGFVLEEKDRNELQKHTLQQFYDELAAQN